MTATTDELRTVVTALWAGRDDPTVPSGARAATRRDSAGDIRTAPTATEPAEGARGTH